MTIRIDDIEYVDGTEAAHLLGVKKSTLYAYVSRGIVQSFRQGVGRHRLYRRDEIERLRAIAPERVVQEEQAIYTADALPDATDPPANSSLPYVADWAGEH